VPDKIIKRYQSEMQVLNYEHKQTDMLVYTVGLVVNLMHTQKDVLGVT